MNDILLDALKGRIQELEKEKAISDSLIEDFAALNDHMKECRYYTHIEDDSFYDLCQCYNHNYYNHKNLSEKARELIRTRNT